MKKLPLFLAAGFFLFIAAIIVLADQGRLPGIIAALYDFPNGDKVGHFFLMGGLSLLVNLALPARPLRHHILAADMKLAATLKQQPSSTPLAQPH